MLPGQPGRGDGAGRDSPPPRRPRQPDGHHPDSAEERRQGGRQGQGESADILKIYGQNFARLQTFLWSQHPQTPDI